MLSHAPYAESWIGKRIEPAALLPAGMVTGRVRSDGEERIVGAAPVAGTDWRVLVAIPAAPLRDRAWKEVRAVGLPLLAVLTLSSLIGLLIARRVWKPLENLTEAVNRFPHGKEHVPISVDSTDEVGELARAFNAMAAQVAETKSSLERRVAELATLARTGAALTSTLDLPVILDRIAESAVELIGAQRCAVFELDPDEQRLHARVARGMRPDQPFFPVKMGQGAAGSAAHLRRPVFTPDVHREPLPGYDEEVEGGMTLRDIVRQRGYRSILAVPLLSKEDALGAICVY